MTHLHTIKLSPVTVVNALLAAAVVAVAVAGAGCSSPLAARRAQVLEPGELEVSAHPYGEVTTIVDTKTGGLPTPPIAYPWGEATARFGIVDRVDVQLKVDPTIIPEINVAYQLLGDPAKNDFAVTLSGGVKPSIFYLGTVGAGVITTPIEALVDIPIADNACATVGARFIPAVGFASSGATGSTMLFITPGAFAALHFDMGPFFFHPEIAINSMIPLAGANSATSFGSPGAGTLNFAAALGVGIHFDFAKKPAAVTTPAAPTNEPPPAATTTTPTTKDPSDAA